MKKTTNTPTQRELVKWAKAAKLHKHVGAMDYMKVDGIHFLLPIMGQRGRASQMNHEAAYWAPWRFPAHAAPLVEALGLRIAPVTVSGSDGDHREWAYGRALLRSEKTYAQAVCAAVRAKMEESK